MKVLITGISGFVGPHLARELKKNDHEVFGLDRKSSDKNIFNVDLTDHKAVLNFFNSKTFDWVIHLAALSSVNDSWEKPDYFLEVNTGMTKNIIDALKENNTGTKLLITSTSDIYGPQDSFPISEDAKPNPQNPYAKSKLAQEEIAFELFKDNTVVTRAFNHAGPGSSPHLAIPSFAKQISEIEKNGFSEIKVGNLESFRDFTDVRDVVRAYRLLIEKKQLGQIYNICSGVKIQMKEVLNQLLSLSTKKITPKQNPDLMRPSDVPEFYGSYEKLKKQTNWEPSIPFKQTLEDTLNWWREQK